MKKLLVFAILGLSVFAHAETAPLVIGYEGEGKVDTSYASCKKFVVDVFDEDAKDESILRVCATRLEHQSAYLEFQSNYQKFTESTVGKDRRYETKKAVRELATVVRACIAMKMNLTTGGHNIAIDMIPNEIAASCLKLGSSLLNEQILR